VAQASAGCGAFVSRVAPIFLSAPRTADKYHPGTFSDENNSLEVGANLYDKDTELEETQLLLYPPTKDHA